MTQEGDGQNLKAETDHILAVKREHENDLLLRPNVVGVGLGYRQTGGQTTDELALVVMVSHKLPQSTLDPADQIPLTLDGIPVDVQEVGEITVY